MVSPNTTQMVTAHVSVLLAGLVQHVQIRLAQEQRIRRYVEVQHKASNKLAPMADAHVNASLVGAATVVRHQSAL
jgi:hypothetical protein